MRDDIKAAGTGMGWGTVLFLWLIGLSILGGGITLAVQPWFMNKQTEITRNTNMYVTSKVEALRSFKSSYDDNEVKIATYRANHVDQSVIDALEAQQAGTIRQMHQEADLVQNKALIPDDIRDFLAEHPEHG